MTDQVIVDGNNIGRKHNDAVKLSSNGIPTQAIIGCIKTARELIIRDPEAKHTWLWDGKAQWRYDIHPGYKAKRNEPDPRRDASRASFNTQRPLIWKALSLIGVGQMTAKFHEADDLAGIMVRAAKKLNPAALLKLISGDGDWIQLVMEGVSVRDISDDFKHYTLANLMEKVGYRTPYGFLEGKCLMGDGSDDIPGVGGIGEKGAPEFIAEFGSVREFWRQCREGEFKPKKKAHINLASAAGQAAFARNLKIMQLISPHKPGAGEVTYDRGNYDRDAFKAFCEEHSFLSILRGFDEFVAPFENK